MTTQAIQKTKSNLPVQLNSMQDAAALAQHFAQSHVMGATNAAEGMLAVVLINEIGLVKAESNYHIMMGRLSKKAHAVLADFVRAGGTYKILQRDEKGASMEASFKGTVGVYSFTWEQALQEPFVYAGKPDIQRYQLTVPVEERQLKDKYATPRSRMQMLWARLISDTCQALCPDANDGMYPPEVVADFENVDPDKGNATIDISDAQARSEAVEPVIDYTVCPYPDALGLHKAWDTYDTERLEDALKLAEDHHPEITATHKAAIRAVLDSRNND